VGKDQAVSIGGREYRPILVVTVDTVPWPYTIIGPVFVRAGGFGKIEWVFENLSRAGFSVGADAVIGVRLSHIGYSAIAVESYGIGTAVRWLRQEETSVGQGTAADSPHLPQP